MTHSNTIRIEFGSAFDMLDFVQVVSDYVGRLSGLDDDALHWVSVAVRESVVNAIKQGDKIVKIEILDSPKDLFEAQAANLAKWDKALDR